MNRELIARLSSATVLAAVLLTATPSRAGSHSPPPIALSAAVSGKDEISIPSHGTRLNALFYRASSLGPHPVVVFLHGYPGNERNLDLAHVVRRAGFHAIYFDYRGSWGTGGTFSFQNSLDDLAAVLDWIRAPENVKEYGFDPAHITLVGHSFGGWLALMSAANQPDKVCIASLAGWNVGWAAKRFGEYPKERQDSLEYFKETTDKDSGPIDAKPDDLLQEMSEHAAAWDYFTQVTALVRHPLLMVGATDDSPDEDAAMSRSFAAAVRKAGSRRVHSMTFEDDHPFSASRDPLATAVVHWLKSDCAPPTPHSIRH